MLTLTGVLTCLLFYKPVCKNHDAAMFELTKQKEATDDASEAASAAATGSYQLKSFKEE